MLEDVGCTCLSIALAFSSLSPYQVALKRPFVLLDSACTTLLVNAKKEEKGRKIFLQSIRNSASGARFAESSVIRWRFRFHQSEQTKIATTVELDFLLFVFFFLPLFWPFSSQVMPSQESFRFFLGNRF